MTEIHWDEFKLVYVNARACVLFTCTIDQCQQLFSLDASIERMQMVIDKRPDKIYLIPIREQVLQIRSKR